MRKRSASWQRLLRLVNRLEPGLRRDVTRVLEGLAAAVGVQRIEALLRAGRIGELERLASDLPMRLRRVSRSLEQAAERAALLQQLQAVNPLAVEAGRREAARLVREITRETRTAITQIVTDALSAQLTPREAAGLIKATLGLSRQQARAVARRRRILAAEGLARDVIDARVARYGEKLRRYRATMIARTEIMRAANAGTQAAWEQAAREGRVQNLERVWIVTPDDRLCPICAPMSGQRRALNVPFVSPTNGQSAQTPPIHPQCRCALGLVATAVSRRAAA